MDWFAVVFNPSFPYRLTHMATAAFVATAFFVGASAAWHLLRGRDNPAIRKMLSMAMWMALIVAPIQALIGDFHGLNTLKHQPAKIAAIEGHWENVGDEPTPLILFGWPDMGREETRFKLEIPALGSLILPHRLDKQVPALKEFPPEDRPNSSIVFWSFRVMVGLGMLMVLTGIWSLCCGCAVGHRPALVQPAQSVLVPAGAGAGVGAGLYPGPAARGERTTPTTRRSCSPLC